MLSITNLSLQYGGQHLFRDLSVQIHSGERVGLVGVNGAGKSTLMRIMCGAQESEPGVVNRASWFSTAYLPQEPNLKRRGLTLYELPVGTHLRIGPALLEVTQIGKECHADCAIRKQVGDCVMPREGIFTKVLEGGTIKAGDEIIQLS